MALLGRIFVVIFAVLVASLAAGIVFAFGVLGPQWHGVTGDAFERGTFTVMVFVGAVSTGAIGLLPLALLIGVAEAFKLRSLLVNVLAGIAILMFAYYSSGLAPAPYEESIDRAPPPIRHETEVAIAAGAVFGLSYWLLAGRNAGRWREKRQPSG
jgi:putative copper export protein